MGGNSGEREVSLASGAQVVEALIQAGHAAVGVDPTRGVLDPNELSEIRARGILPPSTAGREGSGSAPEWDAAWLWSAPLLREVDLLFPILHGGAGEDGTLQGLLELAGFPFVGSDRLGCTLAMDKEVSKRLFHWAGIPTAPWSADPSAREGIERDLGFPLVVKPPSGGSTLGLSVVRDRAALGDALSEARRFEARVLLERFVGGRELTVGVVGGEALPVGEIIPEHEIFDYTCKYEPGMAKEIFPADLPGAVAAEAQALALRVHELLFLRDFSRVDFILDPEGRLWCLEANALPGMTANSLLPRAAAAAGWSFPELCDRIVQGAMDRVDRGAHTPGTPSASMG
jgi:D-alanine-D-alanine ligase